MGAIRMAQSGGVDVTKHVGKSAKGGGGGGASGEKEGLGSLGEVNSGISQKLKKSTGVDVSDAKVVSDPKLEDMGKRGVARDGKEIGVAMPELVGDDELMAHEGIHIVQQRGGSEGEDQDISDSNAQPTDASLDAEAEAKLGSRTLLGDEKLHVQSVVSTPLYKEETEPSEEVTSALDGMESGAKSGRSGYPVLPGTAADGAIAGAGKGTPTPLSAAQVEKAIKDYKGKEHTEDWTMSLQEFLHVPATGVFDATAAQALAIFQSKEQVEIDGQVGDTTLEELQVRCTELRQPNMMATFDATKAIDFNNQQQFRIDWVRKLQKHLGVADAYLSTDGNFDEDTVTKLKDYQFQHALDADGKITPLTRRALETEVESLKEPLIGPHRDMTPRLLVDSGLDQEKYEAYRTIILEAGGHFKDDAGENKGKGAINLVAIRGVEMVNGKLFQTASAAEFAQASEGGLAHDHFSAKKDNPFDDIIVSLRKDVDDEGKVTYLVSERMGSVDPNEVWEAGTAHLRDGQYEYGLGSHGTSTEHPSHMKAMDKFDRAKTRGEAEDEQGPVKVWGNQTSIRYTALNAKRRIEIWREHPSPEGANEPNNLSISDAEEKTSRKAVAHGQPNHVKQDSIDINIHSCSDDEASSQGCQNVPVGQYEEFIKEIDQSTNKNNVLYTLVDASKVELSIKKTEEL